MPNLKLHAWVAGWLGLLLLFAGTYTIALCRGGKVTQSKEPEKKVAVAIVKADLTDQSQLEMLRQSLYNQINQSWQTTPQFDQELAYQVDVTPSGTIAAYKPLNQSAQNYLNETPLVSLSLKSRRPSTDPLGHFLVVFTNSGALKVSRMSPTTLSEAVESQTTAPPGK